MIKLAVIGDPIEHSLSPAVHSAALDAIEIPYNYEKIQVKKGELEPFLNYATETGITGFNLTMPHKVDILPYLSGMDDEAARFQSVNTVKVVEGKFYGFNTDAEGYTASLRMAGRTFQNSRTVILGAGGVVRTLALKAAWEGAKEIYILNRTLDKAEGVAKSVFQKTGVSITAKKLSTAELYGLCPECDILINATPLGMDGIRENFTDLSFLKELPQKALVSDLIYNPAETLFLSTAKQLGLDILNGLGMLIYQALLADKIYTEKEFDMQEVYRCVVKSLEKRF